MKIEDLFPTLWLMFLTIIALLMTILVYVQCAPAEVPPGPIKVMMVVVDGERQVQDLEAVKEGIYAAWNGKMPQPLRVTKTIRMNALRDACGLTTFSGYLEGDAFYCSKGWLQARGVMRARKLTLIVAPPMRIEGDPRWWLAGLADYAQYWRKYGRGRGALAIIWCTDKRYAGEEGLSACWVAGAHELAHTVGARHYNLAPNIMHQSALEYAGEGIRFEKISVMQVRDYLRRLK